jgi:hypothetical protein
MIMETNVKIPEFIGFMLMFVFIIICENTFQINVERF